MANEAVIKVGAKATGSTSAAFNSVAAGMKKVSAAMRDHAKSIKGLSEEAKKTKLDVLVKNLDAISAAAKRSAVEVGKGFRADAFKAMATSVANVTKGLKNQTISIKDAEREIDKFADKYAKLEKTGKAYSANDLARIDKVKAKRRIASDELTKLKAKELDYIKRIETAESSSMGGLVRWQKVNQKAITATITQLASYDAKLKKVKASVVSVGEYDLAKQAGGWKVAGKELKTYSARVLQLLFAYKKAGGEMNIAAGANRQFTAYVIKANAALKKQEAQLKKDAIALAKAEKQTTLLGTAVNKLARSFKTYLSYTLVSGGIFAVRNAFNQSIKTVVEYDQALHDLQAITGATDAETKQFANTIQQVAATTKFSTTEVANGMKTLGQAGFTAQESIAAIQGVSDLATGTLTSMETAVDLTTTAIRVFRMEASDAGHVSDVFANAVNKSKLTVDKLRIAFNYVGPIAKIAGVSFEDLASTTAVLGNSGIRASTIGTGLRQVFSKIVNPTEKFSRAVKEAGLTLADLNPKQRSMQEVLSNLSLVVTDADDAFRLFGMRGSAAVAALAQAGGKDFAAMSKMINRTGTAAEMAAKQMEGLGVISKNISDKIGVLTVKMSEESGLTGMLRGLGKATQRVLDVMIDWADNGLVKVILGVSLLAIGLTGLAFSIGAVKASMAGGWLLTFARYLWSVAIGANSAALANTGFAGSLTAIRYGLSMLAPWLLVITVAVGLGIAAWKLYGRESVKSLTKTSDKAREAVDGLSKQEEKFKDLSDAFDDAVPGTAEYTNLQDQHASLIDQLIIKYPELGARIRENSGDIDAQTESIRKLNEEKRKELTIADEALISGLRREHEQAKRKLAGAESWQTEEEASLARLKARKSWVGRIGISMAENRVAKSAAKTAEARGEAGTAKQALFGAVERQPLLDASELIKDPTLLREYLATQNKEVDTYTAGIVQKVSDMTKALVTTTGTVSTELINIADEVEGVNVTEAFGGTEGLRKVEEFKLKLADIESKVKAAKDAGAVDKMRLLREADAEFKALQKSTSGDESMRRSLSALKAEAERVVKVEEDKVKKVELAGELKLAKEALSIDETNKLLQTDYLNKEMAYTNHLNEQLRSATAFEKKRREILIGVSSIKDITDIAKEKESGVKLDTEAEKLSIENKVKFGDTEGEISAEKSKLEADVREAARILEIWNEAVDDMSTLGFDEGSEEGKALILLQLKAGKKLSEAKSKQHSELIALRVKEYAVETKLHKATLKNSKEAYETKIKNIELALEKDEISAVEAAKQIEAETKANEESQAVTLSKMRSLAVEGGLKDKVVEIDAKILDLEQKSLDTTIAKAKALGASVAALEALGLKQLELESKEAVLFADTEISKARSAGDVESALGVKGAAMLAPLEAEQSLAAKKVSESVLPSRSVEYKSLLHAEAEANFAVNQQKVANDEEYLTTRYELMQTAAHRDEYLESERLDAVDEMYAQGKIGLIEHTEKMGEASDNMWDQFGGGFAAGLLEMQENAITMVDIGKAAAQEIASGLTDAFSSIADGSKDAKEAFSDFAKDFLSKIADMILQSLILEAIGSTGGDSGGGSGIAGLVGTVVGAMFAADGGSAQHLSTGGKVQGYSPTPTSDNIDAKLTANEFVEPVSSVKHYGLGFMEAVRTRMFPKDVVQAVMGGLSVDTTMYPKAKYAFADGGQVPSAPAPAQDISVKAGDNHFSIANILDKGIMGDYLDSTTGEKSMINFITKNQSVIKGILR